MADWFSRLTGQSSASKAKERLKLVLIHDRTEINPKVMEIIQQELITMISRHVPIDAQAAKISVLHEGREQRLVCDIPLKTRLGK